MQVDHIALWTNNLEDACAFWCQHFNEQIGEASVQGRLTGLFSFKR